jgi:hypothetical protein
MRLDDESMVPTPPGDDSVEPTPFPLNELKVDEPVPGVGIVVVVVVVVVVVGVGVGVGVVADEDSDEDESDDDDGGYVYVGVYSSDFSCAAPVVVGDDIVASLVALGRCHVPLVHTSPAGCRVPSGIDAATDAAMSTSRCASAASASASAIAAAISSAVGVCVCGGGVGDGVGVDVVSPSVVVASESDEP